MKHQHSHKPSSILLVEDSEDDYEATIRAFKKADMRHPVAWCKSGQEALDFLRQEGNYKKEIKEQHPDLVLLDLNMPGMDGRKTLQLIKEDSELKKIPVVVLTTSGDERDIETCYRMGANTYVQKPVNFDGLIEAIRGLKAYWFDTALLPKQ